MKKFLKIVGCVILCSIVLIGTGFFVLTSDAQKIDPTNIYATIDCTSFLYDSNGRQIDTLYYTENRQLTEHMPDDLKNAFIAIEDKTFYKHHGFNFIRMFGAVWNTITGKSEAISGTSTITQQLARNLYLQDTKSERTIKRKLLEMYYAIQLERHFSKDEILEAYLNTIYLGYGSYGVNAAAKTYFSKDVYRLNLKECAALAALPQAPDEYALIKEEGGDNRERIGDTDLYSNDVSRDRRYLVLDLMADQGFITEKQAKKAKVEITDILNPYFGEPKSVYTYFSDYVAEAVADAFVKEYGMDPEVAQRKVYTGGLHIYTTLNSQAQQIIHEEFKNDYNFPLAYGTEDKAQAAMVITEIGTGKVIAMVGGRRAEGSKLFNRATSPRQPGSSIKPLSVYGSALQKSYECAQSGQKFPFTDFDIDRQGTTGWGDYITAGSTVIDEKMYINGQVWPYNITRRFTGKTTFRRALQQSINTCAVKILLQVGVDYSAQKLKDFGLTTVVTDESKSVNDLNPAALALGAMTYGVTPLEMSSAFAVFPNGGVYNSPICYTKVTDNDGNVLLTGKSEEHDVLDPGVAWIMTDLLKSVVSRGIAQNAAIMGVEAGGKTGTTDDRFDIWFDGFTPKYSAALWIGTDHNFKMSSTSVAASRLWGKIMRQIPNVTEGEYKEMPNNVVTVNGEYFSKGTEPAWFRDPTEEPEKPKVQKKKTDDYEPVEEEEGEEYADGYIDGFMPGTVYEEEEE